MGSAWRDVRAFTAGFCLFVIVGWSLMLLSPQASAHPGAGCINGIWQVEGNENNQTPHSLDAVKSDILFPDGNDDCIRVSSIAILHDGGEVEVGWVLGWHPSGGNQYSGPGACQDDDYFQNPQIFDVWVPAGGDYHCRNLGSDSHGSDVFHSVSAADGNLDSNFNISEGGSQLDTVNVNFSEGQAATNGERHNLSVDTSRAHFEALQRQIDGGAYHDWTNAQEFVDTDPDFHFHKNSDVNTEVIHD